VICCCICSLFLTRYYFSQDTTNHTFENKARAFHAALNFFFCPQIMVFTVVLTLYVVAIQIAKFSMDYNNKFIYISNAGFNLYVLVLYTWGCSIATADVLQQFMDFGIVAHHSMSRLLAGIYRNICRLLGLESGRQRRVRHMRLRDHFLKVSTRSFESSSCLYSLTMLGRQISFQRLRMGR
jgi:hypothetical protein